MAEQSKGGPTVKLYKGRHYPLDTKEADLEKLHEKRVAAEQKGDATSDGLAWREFDIAGTSGSAQEQPGDGVVNDDKSAKKGAKEAEKADPAKK